MDKTIYCKYGEIENINETLSKVKIYVLHEGININQTNISFEAIEEAKDTLKNIPILAYVEDGDFLEHEIEQKVLQENNKLVTKRIYHEKPVGVIPEQNNYHYEEIDGIRWVVVDGYIWNLYARESFEILDKADEKKKNISMEIKIKVSSKNSNSSIVDIKKFIYTGITVIGEQFNPAMGENATIQLYSSDKKTYDEKVKEVNALLNFTKTKEKTYEVNSLEENKNSEQNNSNEENNNSEQNNSNEENKNNEQNNSNEDNKNNELSVNYITREIIKELEKNTVLTTVYWEEEPVELPKYYFVDLLQDSHIAIVDTLTYGEYYGIPYNVNGDIISLNFNEIKPYTRQWREKVSSGIELFSVKINKKEELIKQSFNKIKELYATVKQENENYKENIKNETIRKEADEIFAKFSFIENSKEINSLKEIAYTGKINKDDLLKELYAIQGRKYIEEKEKFSSNRKDTTVPIVSSNSEKIDTVYGELYKYFKKD